MDLEKSRNNFVLQRISHWSETDAKETTAKAQGLPITLRTQGILVTLVRLLAADRSTDRILRSILVEWLTRAYPSPFFGKAIEDARDMLDALPELSHARYLAVQREALTLAERIKLLAKALHG